MHLCSTCFLSFSLLPLLTFLSPFLFLHFFSLPFSVPPQISLQLVLSFLLPFLLFPPSASLLLSCNPQFTGFPGFPGHIVASQRKLAQHSAINNWRRPTWPGTLSLNGLFWEKSMLACEGFIRACRWNVQGHHQCTPLCLNSALP